MPRRVSLPAADDLFRPTSATETPHQDGDPGARPAAPSGQKNTEQRDTGQGDTGHKDTGQKDTGQKTGRTPSGRVRHDEKMTVYVTSDELLDLEHARLTLRRSGLSVDRGRLVREAVAIALADLDANGDDSVIVQRLTQA
ncbi:MAG: hypothetical protein ACXVXD_03595 [Nocardioidaceae bacterium]